MVKYVKFKFNKTIYNCFWILYFLFFSRKAYSNPTEHQGSAELNLGKAALHVFSSRDTPLSIISTLMGWTVKETDFDARQHSVQNCAVRQLDSNPATAVCFLSRIQVAGACSKLHTSR